MAALKVSTGRAEPPMNSEANRLLFVVDIAGTLVFAVEGATAAMRANLDLLGLMVLAFATALGGGIIDRKSVV